MKIHHIETLISKGSFSQSVEWKVIRDAVHKAVRAVDWPHGSGTFKIQPVKDGNGVKPIKVGLMAELESQGWKLEKRLDIATAARPGKLDAVLDAPQGPVAIEWETGNISSSHRALNKMAVGIMKNKLAAGMLVVPSRALYTFLTDRVGNFPELAPYLDLWRSITCVSGVLEIVVVEHDATDPAAPLIPKGTDGRARR